MPIRRFSALVQSFEDSYLPVIGFEDKETIINSDLIKSRTVSIGQDSLQKKCCVSSRSEAMVGLWKHL